MKNTLKGTNLEHAEKDNDPGEEESEHKLPDKLFRVLKAVRLLEDVDVEEVL